MAVNNSLLAAPLEKLLAFRILALKTACFGARNSGKASPAFPGMMERMDTTSEIQGMTEGCVAKTMYGDLELVIHLVNTKYDWIQDTVKPAPITSLQIRLPEGVNASTLTYYTPETDPVSLDYTVDGDMLSVTLPSLDVWGIIHIN